MAEQSSHGGGGEEEERKDFEERLRANVLYTFSVLLRKSIKSLLKTVRAELAVYSVMTRVCGGKGEGHTRQEGKKTRGRIERVCVCTRRVRVNIYLTHSHIHVIFLRPQSIERPRLVVIHRSCVQDPSYKLLNIDFASSSIMLFSKDAQRLNQRRCFHFTDVGGVVCLGANDIKMDLKAAGSRNQASKPDALYFTCQTREDRDLLYHVILGALAVERASSSSLPTGLIGAVRHAVHTYACTLSNRRDIGRSHEPNRVDMRPPSHCLSFFSLVRA